MMMLGAVRPDHFLSFFDLETDTWPEESRNRIGSLPFPRTDRKQILISAYCRASGSNYASSSTSSLGDVLPSRFHQASSGLLDSVNLEVSVP